MTSDSGYCPFDSNDGDVYPCGSACALWDTYHGACSIRLGISALRGINSNLYRITDILNGDEPRPRDEAD